MMKRKKDISPIQSWRCMRTGGDWGHFIPNLKTIPDVERLRAGGADVATCVVRNIRWVSSIDGELQLLHAGLSSLFASIFVWACGAICLPLSLCFCRTEVHCHRPLSPWWVTIGILKILPKLEKKKKKKSFNSTLNLKIIIKF